MIDLDSTVLLEKIRFDYAEQHPPVDIGDSEISALPEQILSAPWFTVRAST
jgi:hypothetical protein